MHEKVAYEPSFHVLSCADPMSGVMGLFFYARDDYYQAYHVLSRCWALLS
jgi:hypothetical protein